MNTVSTRANAAALLNGQSKRAKAQSPYPLEMSTKPKLATRFAYARILVCRAPAFAPLHRFINCLMAEASDRTE
jgi:hypothetical protein